jgi:hypothetical protein
MLKIMHFVYDFGQVGLGCSMYGCHNRSEEEGFDDFNEKV